MRLKQDNNLHLDYTVMKSNRLGRLVDVPAHSSDKAFRARLKKSNWIQKMLEVNSYGVAHINDGVRGIIQALVETHSETVRHELKKLGLGIARTMDEFEVGAILRETNIGDSK